MKIALALFLFFLYSANIYSQINNDRKYRHSETEAKALVQKVLKQSRVIDGHNDLFVQFVGCKSCPRDLNDYKLDTITTGHTDIPRWRKGGVGAVLMNKWLECHMKEKNK